MSDDSAQAQEEASLRETIANMKKKLNHRTRQVRRLRTENRVLVRAILSLQRERRQKTATKEEKEEERERDEVNKTIGSCIFRVRAPESSLESRLVTSAPPRTAVREEREHGGRQKEENKEMREREEIESALALSGRNADLLSLPLAPQRLSRTESLSRAECLSRIEHRRRRLRAATAPDTAAAVTAPAAAPAPGTASASAVASASAAGAPGSASAVASASAAGAPGSASAAGAPGSASAGVAAGRARAQRVLRTKSGDSAAAAAGAATANPNQLGLAVNPNAPRSKVWYVHQVLRLALAQCVRVGGESWVTTESHLVHEPQQPPSFYSVSPVMLSSSHSSLSSPARSSVSSRAHHQAEKGEKDKRHQMRHTENENKMSPNETSPTNRHGSLYSTTTSAAVQRAIDEVIHLNFCCRRNTATLIRNFTKVSHLPKFSEENTDIDLFQAFSENSGHENYRTDCLRVTFHAPVVFSQVRGFLRMDIAELQASLTTNSVWRQATSPGKSGTTLIYFGNYVMKSVKENEFNFLKHRFLSNYAAFCERNPNTMLPRFYALLSLTWIHSFRSKRFVLMQNVFSTSHYIHRIYDVKGSTVGRTTTVEEAPRTSFGALLLKDNDLPAQLIICGPIQRAHLLAQLRSDTNFLFSLHIVDYSCLIGVRSRVFSRKEGPTKTIVLKKRSGNEWTEHVDSAAIGVGKEKDLCNMSSSNCIAACDGGLLSLPIYSAGDDTTAREDVYYIGIIDVLQVYTPAKRLESFAKGLWNDRRHISVVPPKEYAERLYSTVENIVV